MVEDTTKFQWQQILWVINKEEKDQRDGYTLVTDKVLGMKYSLAASFVKSVKTYVDCVDLVIYSTNYFWLFIMTLVPFKSLGIQE